MCKSAKSRYKKAGSRKRIDNRLVGSSKQKVESKSRKQTREDREIEEPERKSILILKDINTYGKEVSITRPTGDI